MRVETAIAGKARGETLGDRGFVDATVVEGDRGDEAGAVSGVCCAFVGDRGGDPGPIAMAFPLRAPLTLLMASTPSVLPLLALSLSVGGEASGVCTCPKLACFATLLFGGRTRAENLP